MFLVFSAVRSTVGCCAVAVLITWTIPSPRVVSWILNCRALEKLAEIFSQNPLKEKATPETVYFLKLPIKR